MNFNQPIMDVIQQRFSCRKYKESALDIGTAKNIENYISNNTNAPFRSKIRFVLVSANKEDSEELRGLGTYGFIRNPSGFIIGVGEESKKNLEDFGYLMEKNILYATSIGLGTCWLGASFKKSNFEKRANVTGNEEVLAIAALGYSPEDRSVIERVARFAMKSNSRKPWNQLFYENDLTTSLNEIENEYAEVLEMVRLAPSAGNLQPWRIIKNSDGNKYHFYLNRTKGYNKIMRNRADLQRIDIGIAMSHFELTAKELNLTGMWKVDDPQIESKDKPLEYISTWIC